MGEHLAFERYQRSGKWKDGKKLWITIGSKIEIRSTKEHEYQTDKASYLQRSRLKMPCQEINGKSVQHWLD